MDETLDLLENQKSLRIKLYDKKNNTGNYRHINQFQKSPVSVRHGGQRNNSIQNSRFISKTGHQPWDTEVSKQNTTLKKFLDDQQQALMNKQYFDNQQAIIDEQQAILDSENNLHG